MNFTNWIYNGASDSCDCNVYLYEELKLNLCAIYSNDYKYHGFIRDAKMNLIFKTINALHLEDCKKLLEQKAELLVKKELCN